jgi:hypothetical protein
MPVDIAQWIKGLELPEAEQKVVLEAIGKGGEKALKYIEGNQLRQDEFSRKLDDVKKKETDLAKAIEDENKFHTELASWKRGSEKRLADATAAREAAERKLATARDKVKELGTEYEIPAETLDPLFEGVTTPNNNEPPVRREPEIVDPDLQPVTMGTFRAEARAYAKFAALIPSLEREHYRLFGDTAEAPNWEKLIEETVAARGAKTIKQVYEETFKVAEKREEIRNNAHQADIEKARKEGADAERTKILADNPTAATSVRTGERQGSPVLAMATRQAAEAAKNGTPPPRTTNPVQAAVNAFNDGKYKVA